MKENICFKNRAGCIVGLSFSMEHTSFFRFATTKTEYINGLCSAFHFKKFKYCPNCGRYISWKKIEQDKKW